MQTCIVHGVYLGGRHCCGRSSERRLGHESSSCVLSCPPQRSVCRKRPLPRATLHLFNPPAVSLSLGIKRFRQAELLLYLPIWLPMTPPTAAPPTVPPALPPVNAEPAIAPTPAPIAVFFSRRVIPLQAPKPSSMDTATAATENFRIVFTRDPFSNFN